MDNIGSPHNSENDSNKTTILFLGLFLLVLAFFILLVSISTIQKTKSEKVMESLVSTFADVSSSVTAPENFVSKSGESLGPEEFLSVIDGVFTSLLKIDTVEIVQPGRIMRINFPAHELFVDGQVEPKEEQDELIDRIIASFSSAATSLEIEMVFLSGSPLREDGDLPSQETLEMKRVGSFLRKAIERGVDQTILSGGISPGNPEGITIYFYVHDKLSAQSDSDHVTATQDLP